MLISCHYIICVWLYYKEDWKFDIHNNMNILYWVNKFIISIATQFSNENMKQKFVYLKIIDFYVVGVNETSEITFFTLIFI